MNGPRQMEHNGRGEPEPRLDDLNDDARLEDIIIRSVRYRVANVRRSPKPVTPTVGATL
jgi:hypothetical protein